MLKYNVKTCILCQGNNLTRIKGLCRRRGVIGEERHGDLLRNDLEPHGQALDIFVQSK